MSVSPLKMSKFWKALVERTVLAVWWLVVGGAGLWVVVGSIGYFSRSGWLPPDTAGWAQAVGAGLAIVVATFIPIWHIKVATHSRQENLLGVMRVLADEALEKIWILTNTFIQLEFAPKMMREYLFHRRDQDWPGLVDAVAKIPLAELPPAKAKLLGELRDAVEFASRVAVELPIWIDRGYAQPEMLVALRAKRDLLSIGRAQLPQLDGVTVKGKVNAQVRGEPHEIRRPALEPYMINGAKVFRYYIWESVDSIVPIGALVQCLFMFGSNECESHYLPGFDWETMER